MQVHSVHESSERIKGVFEIKFQKFLNEEIKIDHFFLTFSNLKTLYRNISLVLSIQRLINNDRLDPDAFGTF
jgi:hypothetical protein